jgi:N-acetylglutamate synthase
MDLKALLPEIEAAALRGWPALETMAIDGWLWRHTSGGSVRANSVATLQFTGPNAERTIDQMEALARSRSTSVCFAISDVAAPADLDARLAQRGYHRGDNHVTMAKRVDPNAAAPDGVTVAATPSPGWLAAYLSGLSLDRRAMAPRILERLPKSATFVAANDGGRIISSGLTIPDGAVASIQCMATLPDARNRGGARRVLAAVQASAAIAGATTLYLQTGADNTAARGLYSSLGYSVIGAYHTRTKAV